MPIPAPSVADGPRRLLRDVVFDKMRDAIVDGTLEAGERLNDNDLVAWLGVSRTPVREAIAKLHSLGLVEVEANRYTRVATRSAEDYQQAAQLLSGYHELGEKWGLPTLTSTQRKSLRQRIEKLEKRLTKRELAATHELLDAQGELVRAADNALFTAEEAPLRLRVKFLMPLDRNEVDFDAFSQRAAELVESLQG